MNNKVNCKIITDLLPLYSLGECSEETKKLVREHLDGCEACRAELGTYSDETAALLPAVDEGKAISEFSAKLRRQNIVRAITIAAFILTMIFGVVVLGIVPEFVADLEEADITVEEPVDGGIDITVGAKNYKHVYASCEKNDDLSMDIYLTVVDNVFTMITPDADRSDNLVRIGNGLGVSYNNGGTVLFHVPSDVESYNIYYAEAEPGGVADLVRRGQAKESENVQLIWSSDENAE